MTNSILTQGQTGQQDPLQQFLQQLVIAFMGGNVAGSNPFGGQSASNGFGGFGSSFGTSGGGGGGGVGSTGSLGGL